MTQNLGMCINDLSQYKLSSLKSPSLSPKFYVKNLLFIRLRCWSLSDVRSTVGNRDISVDVPSSGKKLCYEIYCFGSIRLGIDVSPIRYTELNWIVTIAHHVHH